MTSSLSGKAIVITGAFGILGASTARTQAGAGGGTDAAEYGGVELTQSVDAAKIIDDIYRRFGCLDVRVAISRGSRIQQQLATFRPGHLCSPRDLPRVSLRIDEVTAVDAALS